MKLRITSLSVLTIVCVMMAVAPAMADTLYSNGAPNGNVDAFTINFGFAVSDSFTRGAGNGLHSIEGFNFVSWSIPGDNLTSVEMQLGSCVVRYQLYRPSPVALQLNIVVCQRFWFQHHRVRIHL